MGSSIPVLAADPRVVSLEGVNARALPAELLARLPPPDWITADVSFISLKLACRRRWRSPGPARIWWRWSKPQFEAGPDHVRKGIVRDPEVQARVCDDIAAFLAARADRGAGRCWA